MDFEELREEIAAIIDREPDPDDSGRDIPHPRLRDVYSLDPSYLETFAWEGSTIHPRTRIWPADERRLHRLVRNSDVPSRLFEAGLRLLGNSIVAYHGRKKRTGPLLYYPGIVLTFWSAFEAFVRYSSELMLITVKDMPSSVVNLLREVDDSTLKTRYRPVLDRYAALLRHGYNYQVNKGAKHWQRLESARTLRDYYTHLNVNDPRSISTLSITDFMEAVLLGIIWPSCEVKRTQLLGIYNLYWTWDELRELSDPYVEQPFFKDWNIGGTRDMFYCPFDGVDAARFPNSYEERLGSVDSSI